MTLQELPSINYAANEARIIAIKARRAVAIIIKDSLTAQHRASYSLGSKAALLAADDTLRAINLELHERGAVSRSLMGGGIAKTKRELIGSLRVWMEQMRETNKNPRTSLGEKLFGARAIERLNLILKSNETP